ncbi:WD repeat domain phosphoinositide-interacting protein 2 [Saguinus oedipus]|uniref:WD repeat domain phosphoinositide-interacting protein 2 n=1 Tax=Saguinus oedipus TaxID=9490 RepID=A0ABQ9TB58_SAGOE|nr:WD repeat domain phosphoinositide-interacting protein 2 [Saguinus oedipus]KAK2082638.1 WD repeat domain phosphoinositide-interacting protein 2 [Saguinus oedipus]
MNLASQSAEAGAGKLPFANFNQDNTAVKRGSRATGPGHRAVVWSLAVSSKSGYKFFSLSSVDKLEQIYECTDTEDVCIVDRLFSSSLVAILSLKAPRKLKVCHFKKGTEICNYSYSNTILAVKLNRQRLIVCLEESLYIHSIRDMKVLHTIRETPPNPAGLCVLSINNDNCCLACPGSSTIGEVQSFNTINLRAANLIPAHDSPLAALAFDTSGTKLATASEKVTVIRVFSIPEGQKLFEFRRGVKRCVSICSLAFSMDGMFLSASSNTETVHINSRLKEKPPEEPTTWTGYFGKVLMASTSYLPSQVTEMFNQGRAFATVRLPFCGHKNICSLATIQKIPRLLVGASDGYLYMYNLDSQEGGECALMKQHRLDGSLETANEILDSASHDCPLVTQKYGAAAAKAYADDQVGGTCLEDEASALCLDEDREQPPMILRTD